jgi:hypothetical protein
VFKNDIHSGRCCLIANNGSRKVSPLTASYISIILLCMYIALRKCCLNGFLATRSWAERGLAETAIVLTLPRWLHSSSVFEHQHTPCYGLCLNKGHCTPTINAEINISGIPYKGRFSFAASVKYIPWITSLPSAPNDLNKCGFLVSGFAKQPSVHSSPLPISFTTSRPALRPFQRWAPGAQLLRREANHSTSV